MQKLFTAGAPMLGEGEDRRDDGTGRMDDYTTLLGIIEIIDMGADPVHQRGVHDIQAIATAEHAGLRRSRKFAHRSQRRRYGRIPASPNGTADPVVEGPPGLMSYLARDIREVRVDKELGEAPRHPRSLPAGRSGHIGAASRSDARIRLRPLRRPISPILGRSEVSSTVRSGSREISPHQYCSNSAWSKRSFSDRPPRRRT